jgi:hypothetical protein
MVLCVVLSVAAHARAAHARARCGIVDAKARKLPSVFPFWTGFAPALSQDNLI